MRGSRVFITLYLLIETHIENNILSHSSLFLNRVLLFLLWGQEGVLDGVFIDGKTEKEGLRQICPVFSHARRDVKRRKKIFFASPELGP